jgi:hypothetical protein
MRQMRVLCSSANALRIGLLQTERPTGPSVAEQVCFTRQRGPGHATRSASTTHGFSGRPTDVNPQKLRLV